MKRPLLIIIILLSSFNISKGQFTLYKGNGYLEFSGYLTAFYNYRFYPENTIDKKKNTFALDYAVLRFDGVTNKLWHYCVQLNAPALFDPTTSDGFIMQATAAYNAIEDKLSIQFGYDKLPFGRSSLVPNTESPFLQRAEITRGGVFNRRDVGITVNYSLLNKQLELYGGAYTGMGPTSLANENDPSGNLEYLARAEMSWPARYRHLELDLHPINVPVFSLGFGGRYAKKSVTTGVDFPILTIDGQKYSYDLDASFAYKGFTAQFEAIQMRMVPNDTLLLYGKPTNYFKAGGIIAQMNYFIKKYKSVVAIRYDELNPNDLVIGDYERTISFAYNYLFDDMRSCVKVHFMKRLKDDKATSVWADDQLRIAYQLMF